MSENPSGALVKVVGEFEADELVLLEEYLQLTSRAVAAKWVQDGCPATLSVSMKAGQPAEVKAGLPDWEHVQAFLMRFRPFILERERTFFPRICNVIARRLRHEAIDRVLAPMRDLFKGKSMRSMVTIRSNDVVLNSPETLDAWLNAFEFHQDLDKRKWLESLHHMMPLESTQVFFLVLLTDRLVAVRRLAKLINVILGHTDAIELRARAGNSKESGAPANGTENHLS